MTFPCFGFLVGSCCGGSPLNLSTLKVTLLSLMQFKSEMDSDDMEELLAIVEDAEDDEEEEEEEEEEKGVAENIEGDSISFMLVC